MVWIGRRRVGRRAKLCAPDATRTDPHQPHSTFLYQPSMKRKTAIRASACEPNRRRASNSHSSVAKKLSHMALSYASPTDPPLTAHARFPAAAAERERGVQLPWSL